MVYDWTGQRTRRIRMLRTASIALVLMLFIAIPAVLLHYDLIQYHY
ncbi:hypothetical protein [Rhizobium sp. BK602]|nr:hypothetical protein [Rhizobium sp. BK602]MBB3610308.1 hypothetical protein [Rhizobium sp. BK602]